MLEKHRDRYPFQSWLLTKILEMLRQRIELQRLSARLLCPQTQNFDAEDESDDLKEWKSLGHSYEHCNRDVL